MNASSSPALRIVPFILDALAVIVFAVLGAKTHHDGGLDLASVGDVAWPFLVGLGVVHAFVPRPWSLRFGLIAWVGVVAIGMVIRQLTGDGTALAFVLVATGFNLATLVGWRLIALLVAKQRQRSTVS